MSQDLTLNLPDGRTLGYTTFGTIIDPSKSALFYLHGFPSTQHEGLPVHEAAATRGLAVIAVTRPGFGDSTPQPGRTVLSFAGDVLALADHLKVQRFAVLGISGGGPYALGCLKAIPAERLPAVTVVSGMWPTTYNMSGMLTPMRVMHSLARWVPGLVSYMAGALMNDAARDTEHPERFEALMDQNFKRWPAEDQAVIYANDGKLFKVLTKCSVDAIKHGSGSVGVEAKIYGSKWGFTFPDLPSDNGRLEVWHGAKDVNVPITMAEKATEQMPGIKLKRFDDEAHLSLSMKYMDDILDSLIKRLHA